MTPKDLSKTHLAAFGPDKGWREQSFAKLLSEPAVFLTGTSQSFVLGRVTVDEAEVLTLATAPDAQRQGLARRALGDFLDRVHKAGAKTVFLEVAENNQPARALYRQAGFATVGERKNYYRQDAARSVTALILRRDLP